MDKEKDILKEEAILPEAYLTGLFWSDPSQYNMYTADKLNKSHFGNGVYSFFFELGRHLSEKNLVVFDDISVAKALDDLKLHERFDYYGGYETIYELVEEVKDKKDNLQGYIDEVKKYSLLRELRELFGNQVVQVKGKYDYHKMNQNQISTYWSDKVNQIAMNVDSQIQEFDMLDGLQDLIQQLDENPDIGIPYYNSKFLTDLTNGWARGTITMLSAFSGNGKTSFAIEKLFMSCIKTNTKLLVIGNEMAITDFQKLLLITIMGAELYEKYEDGKAFNRKNINKGNFTEEEKQKLKLALEWIESNVKDKKLIKFIPMEDYTINNVEKVVRYYAARGYYHLLVDTAKPSLGGNEQRWVRFVEDFERLYQLARKDGGGLNLALFATVQSADSAINMRFLDERCLGDGRKSKNVADVVFHMRSVWQDELEGEKHEIEVYRYVGKDEKIDNDTKDEDIFGQSPWKRTVLKDKPYDLLKRKLKPGKVYYLLFTSKNRRGMSNLTGADVLVLQVDFNTNKWRELGWTTITRDNL